MNLCTDQLALLIGAEGQVVSVSAWAARPAASNMAEEAARLPLNRGSAERVHVMRPDLVLAGPFSNAASVAMLRRLGVEVAVIEPATSIAEIRANIARIGSLMDREARAAEIDAAFVAELDRLADAAARLEREGAAYHYPNNYTSGAGTLADEVMDRAALDNAAARLGIESVARLDLETLVMLEPFLIRTGSLAGAEDGRAYETLSHPALERLSAGGRAALLAERWQVCGTPFVVLAIEALIAARAPGQPRR